MVTIDGPSFSSYDVIFSNRSLSLHMCTVALLSITKIALSMSNGMCLDIDWATDLKAMADCLIVLSLLHRKRRSETNRMKKYQGGAEA